jgi:hypothetical protein
MALQRVKPILIGSAPGSVATGFLVGVAGGILFALLELVVPSSWFFAELFWTTSGPILVDRTVERLVRNCRLKGMTVPSLERLRPGDFSLGRIDRDDADPNALVCSLLGFVVLVHLGGHEDVPIADDRAPYGEAIIFDVKARCPIDDP